jgi:hypothetical protein
MKILCQHFCLPQTFTNFNDLILPTTEKFSINEHIDIQPRETSSSRLKAVLTTKHVAAADDIKYFPSPMKRSLEKFSLDPSRVDDISPCSGV